MARGGGGDESGEGGGDAVEGAEVGAGRIEEWRVDGSWMDG